MWLIKLVKGNYEVGYFEQTEHGQMWVCFDTFERGNYNEGKQSAIDLCSKLNGGQ